VLPISRPRADREIRDQVSWRDWRPTFVAGGLVVGAVAVLVAAFESVSTFERPIVLESLTGSVYWIAAALIGSCGTIAALMLTTVSLMEQLDTRRLGPRFLIHMRLTVVAALGTIGCAVGALLLTIFPSATGVDVEPPAWQINAVFFGLLALVALMVGGFAVVLSYEAVEERRERVGAR
jgi:MFS family permease